MNNVKKMVGPLIAAPAAVASAAVALAALVKKKKLVRPLIAASAAVASVAVASAAVVKKKGQKAKQEGGAESKGGGRRWLRRCRSSG